MTFFVIMLILVLAGGLAYKAGSASYYSELYDETKYKLESTRSQLRTREVSNTLMDERIRELSQEIAGLKEAQGYMADTLRHRNNLLSACEYSLEDTRIECARRGSELQQLKELIKRKKQSAKRYPEGQAGPGRPKTSAKRKPKA